MKLEDFARVVKSEREKQGLSQAELSRRAGCSKQYVSLLEGCGLSPSIERADAILKELGISCILGVLDKRKRMKVER